MKLRLIVLLLIMVSVFGILSASNGFDVNFAETRTNEFELNFELNDFYLKNVELDGQDFSKIITDCRVTTMEKGFAELPFIHSSVMISPDKNYDLNIIQKEFTDYQLDAPLVPSRGVIYRNENLAEIPYEISDKSLMDQWYPQKLTEQSNPFILREIRGTNVYIYPFQYNAVEQILRVYDSITVELIENDQTPENPLPNNRKLTSDMIPIYNNVFVNFDSRSFANQIGELGELLVLYTSSNGGITPIQPYIDWKREKGFTVHSQSVAYGTNVKNTIRDAYNANTNILYVQLVGDWEHIKSDIGPDSAPTDPMLGCIVGGDYYQEVIVGRFSASSSTDVTTQVNKTINYEKNPDLSGSWYKNAIGIASSEGAGNGDDGEADYQHMDVIRTNKLLPYNYTTMHQDYATNGVTSAIVANHVNAGAGIINYVGHGSKTSWSTSGYSNTNIASSSNGNMLPFINSVACVNGQFHTTGDCFGEAWLKKSGGGAVAALMATINQPWQPPMRGQDYFNDLLIGGYNYSSNPGSGTNTDSSDKRTTFGSLAFNADVLMYTESPYSSDLETIQTWTIFGDASLQIRTDTPTAISLSNSSCMMGTSFNTTVSSGAGLVENALVSLTQNGTNYTAYTDINGYVSINHSLNVGQATLVVSGYNLETEYSVIDVTSNSGPYVSIQNVQVSAGGDDVIEFGEIVVLTVTLENAGSDPATNVSMNLSESSPYLVLSDSSESFGTIAAGSSVTRTSAYVFNVTNNVPNAYAIQLDAAIICSEDNWSDIINLTAYSPDVEIQSVTVNDGDNGLLDPGDTATLECHLINNGGATVSNLNALLSTTDSYITINDNNDTASSLIAGGTAIVYFNVTVSPTAPVGHSINFNTAFTGDNGYSQSDAFSLAVGLVVEDFETGDFSNYDWTFGGDTDWSVVTTSPYEGTYCTNSGNISDNQTSELILEAQIGSAGDLSFYKKVSSEVSYDYLRFYIDDVEQGSWAGTVDWSIETYAVAVGFHEFKWSFEKDVSVSSGSDCAWIDYIEFPPFGQMEADISVNPTTLTFGEVMIGNNSVQSFTITNNGSATLSGNITTPTGYAVVQRANRGSKSFNRDTISYSITSSNSKTYDITFEPTTVANYDGTISITSNDPDTPNTLVSVTGTGVNPPTASLNPSSLTKTMASNASSNELLVISNSGGSNLTYSGNLEYVTRSRDEIINETFDTFPPTGWTTTGGTNWGGYNTNEAGGTAPEARFYWSPSITIEQKLISPEIDTQGFSNVALQFKHLIDDFNGTEYTLRIETTSDGTNWNTLTTFPSTDMNATIENLTIDNADVGSATFQFAFVFDGNSYNINNWNIDDVILTAETGPTYNWLSYYGSATVNGSIVPAGNDNLTIGFDSSGLAEGSYQANLLFTTNDPNNTNIQVPVTLNVNNGGSVDPIISVNTSSLSESLESGQNNTQNFTITNVGDSGSTLTYSITANESTREKDDISQKMSKSEWIRLYENTRDVSWLGLTPNSGSCLYNETDQIGVTFDALGLTAGTYQAIITITSNGGANQTINVTLNVSEASGDYPVSPKSIAEFEPMQGVLIRYPFGISISLIADISQHTNVTTIVTNSSEQSSVTSTYSSNGVNVSNCDFLIESSDSYWTRDYGPLFIRESNQKISLVDFNYNRPRPNDNAIPQALASHLGIDSYLMPIDHTGGNYMTDGMGIASSTTIVYTENSGLTNAEVDQAMQTYCGINEYHVVDDPNNTYINHIDCWGKFLDADKVLIREVPASHAQYTEIENTAAYYAAQTSAYGTLYQVFRVNTPNDEPYTNSIIVNDVVYVPQMGSSYDAAAITSYQNAMPGYTISGFTGDWEGTDAIHCRMKGVADLEMLYVEHSPITDEQSYLNDYDISVSIISYGQHNFAIGFPRLYYRVNSGSWLTSTMINTNGDTYEATIPAQTDGSTVEYYIHTQDVSGRSSKHPFIGESDPHEFAVGGTVPAVLNVSVSSLNKFMEADAIDSEIILLTNDGGGTINYNLALSSGRKAESRDISGSSITCSHSDFTPGEIVTWTFTVTNSSTDAEWLKDIYIDFPIGITVNSATNFVGGSEEMIYDGNIGDGIQINWHGENSSNSDWGVIKGGETAIATVNVTINSNFTGDIIMDYIIQGDIYGGEPHTLNGSITLTPLSNPLSWISLQTTSGALTENETDLILIDFDTAGLTLGQYTCDLIITDDRTITTIPITLEVISQPNYPEWDETDYPNPVAEIHGYATIDGYNAEPGDIVGAFCNGECRGTATVQTVDRAIYFYMRTELSSANEILDFKVYDISTDERYDANYTTMVNSGDTIGSPENPVEVDVVTSIDIPANIAANISGNQLTITWDAVSGATDYKIYSCDTPNGTFVEETGGSLTRSNWSIIITSDTLKKFYYVRAVK
ncbi:MAG: agmatine deiminase family protein [Candidatus Cloacimonetes bacterium]|nr:agmatine deiminase family protein [Candidatus Cloacimonadota bacterium]